jgi:hypothetical protein
MTTVRRHFEDHAEPGQCRTCLQVWPCEVGQLQEQVAGLEYELTRLQNAFRDIVRRVKEILAGLDDDDDESATTNIIPIIKDG